MRGIFVEIELSSITTLERVWSQKLRVPAIPEAIEFVRDRLTSIGFDAIRGVREGERDKYFDHVELREHPVRGATLYELHMAPPALEVLVGPGFYSVEVSKASFQHIQRGYIPPEKDSTGIHWDKKGIYKATSTDQSVVSELSMTFELEIPRLRYCSFSLKNAIPDLRRWDEGIRYLVDLTNEDEPRVHTASNMERQWNSELWYQAARSQPPPLSNLDVAVLMEAADDLGGWAETILAA